MHTNAPLVESVPPGSRPLWSVMIPTYNCANYLRETLASVLAQDPGAERMQIEVIDDHSTKDDPAAVVRELSPDGRVGFFRQPVNGGVVKNFNTCVNRSRGRLVHLLHGDDLAEPGFYGTVEKAAAENPDLALYATRAWEIGPDSSHESVSTRYRMLETPSRNPKCILEANGLRTPTIVIRRSFYEKHGGFLPSLPHSADWEMWVRAIAEQGGIMINQPLAGYRSHPFNDTSRLHRLGLTLECTINATKLFKARYPEFDERKSMAAISKQAFETYCYYYQKKDVEAAGAWKSLWKQHTPAKVRVLYQLKWLAQRAFASRMNAGYAQDRVG